MIGSLAGTIRRLAVFVALLFLALMVNINLVQVTRASSLATEPGNNRGLIKEYARERGAILVDGKAVADSVAGTGRLKYQRVYPNGSLYVSATGFYSLIYGRTGIERVENSVLAGTDARFSLQQISDLLAGRTSKGGSAVLTINAKAQAAAAAGMRGKVGAVVAIQPSTGAILALVQSPTFDPTPLASNDSSVEQAAWAQLTQDPLNPMLNRPLAEVYPPGSTFKIITLTAALSSGKYDLTTEIPSPAFIHLPGSTATLYNDNRRACGNGHVTLLQALEISCNTAFANVGIALGGDALLQQAEAFGFNTSFAVATSGDQKPMSSATSRFPANIVSAQAAQSAIGQYDVRATPLQMAMVAAAVANQGRVMRPYLIQQVLGPDLAQLEPAPVSQFGVAMSPTVAAEVATMMVGVVDNGTGTNAQIPGVRVAGKTGTAQTAPGKPADAWFVAFAPAESGDVAVAVVVEGAPNDGQISGGRLAAPVAKAVMEAILNR
jgi:peptidoglycan glycosyltransferase